LLPVPVESYIYTVSDSLPVCISGPTEICINLTTPRIGPQIHLQTRGGEGDLCLICISQISILVSIAKNYEIYTKLPPQAKQQTKVGLQNGTGNADEVICCLVLKGR
jgi:hypothetical protein